MFDHAFATHLRDRDQEFDRELAGLIDFCLDATISQRITRQVDACYQVFLLSGPTDQDTLRLKHVIRHEGGGAWTQSQRYATSSALSKSPITTEAF
jgi:hypothetical protein